MVWSNVSADSSKQRLKHILIQLSGLKLYQFFFLVSELLLAGFRLLCSWNGLWYYSLSTRSIFQPTRKWQPWTNWLCTKSKETYAKPARSFSSFQSTSAGICSFWSPHSITRFSLSRRIWKLLQPSYDHDEPYRVISLTKKNFTIEINGQHEVVSLDRLNPAYLDTEFSLLDTTSSRQHTLPHTGTSNPVTTTRSGRKVRWPSNLLDQPLIVH